MHDPALLLTLFSTVLAAFLLPIGILITRDNVKAKRQGVIKDLEVFFRSQTSGQNSIIPSFEFVKTKYYVDPRCGYAEPGIDWYSIPVLIFVGLTSACFFVSFGLVVGATDSHFTFGTYIRNNLFLFGGQAAQFNAQYAEQAMTVAMFAFLGSYIHAIKTLVRSVANFDLSPLTFFRASYGIIAAIVIAVALWRGTTSLDAYNPFGTAEAVRAGHVASPVPPAPAASTPDQPVPTPSGRDVWLFVAFVIGFVPGQAERVLLSSWRRGGIKRLDARALDQSKTIPLELIDGIDADVRARLEDFNLFDVQNLATANPIMLFVETPFGIYQSIDWVAQAQLATAVGVDRFLSLRDLSIRNIFEMERLFSSSGNPDALILQQKVADTLAGESHLHNAQGQAVRLAHARALTSLYIDDLAVMRLRQIWMTIERNFAETRRLKPYQTPSVLAFDPSL